MNVIKKTWQTIKTLAFDVKKNNWKFKSDIRSWNISQTNNGYLQTNNIYPLFFIICVLVIINNCLWDTVYIIDILKGYYPFPLPKMLFFLFMETFLTLGLFGILYRKTLTKLGVFGSVYFLTYMMLHHYTDIVSITSLLEYIIVVFVDLVLYPALFLMIISRGMYCVFSDSIDNKIKIINILRIICCILVSCITYYIIEIK